jgi:hypothetical protein
MINIDASIFANHIPMPTSMCPDPEKPVCKHGVVFILLRFHEIALAIKNDEIMPTHALDKHSTKETWDRHSRFRGPKFKIVRLIAREILLLKPAPARVEAAPCRILVPYLRSQRQPTCHAPRAACHSQVVN